MEYINDIKEVGNLDLPWAKLSGCNILIVGATGLIGSCLIDVLMNRVNRDFNVYAMGRNKERAKMKFREYWDNPSFHFVLHNIENELEGNIHFEYIIDMGSNASPNFFVSNPVEVIKANVFGVANLIDYGINHHLKRFLYVSSGEVYGEGDGRIFTEEYSGYVDCRIPRACYPTSKRAAETLCVSYGAEYGIETVIARPCHIYGPGFTESDNRVYAQFIRNVLKGENIVMKSSGSQFRSWCYVVDCVSALLYILLKGDNGEAYNIADMKSNVSIRELAEIIAKITNRQIVVDTPTDTEKKGYNVVPKSVFSTNRLEKLGWKCQNSLQTNLEHTISFLFSVAYFPNS